MSLCRFKVLAKAKIFLVLLACGFLIVVLSSMATRALCAIKKSNFSNLNFKKIPNILGVLNLTPDSFSDGGKFNKKNKGVSHAINLYKTGASLVDVGGESTRPGSKEVNENREWNRINKILKLIVKKIPISLDTRKSKIMENGIRMGVKLINDVSGLSHDLKTINAVSYTHLTLPTNREV